MSEASTVYITGAASGIGLATAHAFAASGATLCLADLDEAGLNRARTEVEHRWNVSVTSFGCDLASEHAAVEFVRRSLDSAGAPDTVVNCAGVARMGTVLETSVEEWDRVFAINARSVFLVSKAVLPAMIYRGRGSIVNVASEAGLVGFRGYAAYSASKAAVVNLTRSMALDCAPLGIRVNAVCPGSIETPLLQAYFDASEDPQKAREDDAITHPLGIGKPEEVASAICYLASPAASYITGHALVVDGGYTAQ